MSNKIANRAETPEQKEALLKRLFDCWANQMPDLRLGQMLLNLVESEALLWVLEDEILVKKLEKWAAEIKEAERKI